jgi:hypothetical protein
MVENNALLRFDGGVSFLNSNEHDYVITTTKSYVNNTTTTTTTSTGIDEIFFDENELVVEFNEDNVSDDEYISNFLHDDDVEEYLKGLLWVVNMYIDGACPDYSYTYSNRPSVSPYSIVKYLECESLAVIEQVESDVDELGMDLFDVEKQNRLLEKIYSPFSSIRFVNIFYNLLFYIVIVIIVIVCYL